VLAALAVALIVVFFAVVAPLFTTGGAPSAELAGAIPASAPVNAPLEIDVGLDNTGTAIISPVCIRASLRGPLVADHAIFQGLDNVAFRNGGACGGSLNGQDTISVRVFLRPTGTGPAQISMVPAQGGTEVGPPLGGSIDLVGH
jgi:hypothetical protein